MECGPPIGQSQGWYSSEVGKMQGFTIALEGDEGFQKFLARKIELGAQLEFSVPGWDVTGFVTGIDSQWLQVSTVPSLEPVQIRIGSVRYVRDTGRRLEDLKSEDAAEVRKYARAITARARRANQTLT
ncbi:conserved hypothetical protein [Rhodococcus phage E3]|uniref:hypothetical protein n=1 Tax=Rhodococcus phage E3 TaxID=1007869 RepID=UPI0002C6AB95|nr:hypothetical protein M176_gp154 [Rhodococcus phage E3]AEQ21062.1 conserved hypothetical protein [Rhodococcus phage E3]